MTMREKDEKHRRKGNAIFRSLGGRFMEPSQIDPPKPLPPRQPPPDPFIDHDFTVEPSEEQLTCSPVPTCGGAERAGQDD